MKAKIYFILGILVLMIISCLSIFSIFNIVGQEIWIGVSCLVGLIFIILGFKNIKIHPQIDYETRKELEKMGETEDYPRR